MLQEKWMDPRNCYNYSLMDTFRCHTTTTSRSVLRRILGTFDLMLLLLFCFVCSYTLFGFDTLVSMVTTHYFHFTPSQTSIVFIVDGVLYACVLVTLVRLSALMSDYHIILVAVVVQVSYLIRINFRAGKFSCTLDSEKFRADLFSRSPIKSR